MFYIEFIQYSVLQTLISEVFWKARFPPPQLRVKIAASMFANGTAGNVKTPVMTEEKLVVRVRRVGDSNCPFIILDDGKYIFFE